MPGRRLPTVALAVAVLATVSCGDDGGGDEEAPTTAPTTTAGSVDAAGVQAIEVELTDSGAEPRRSLDLDLSTSQSWEGRLRFEFQPAAGTRVEAEGPSRLDVLPREDGDADASAILGPLAIRVDRRDGPQAQPADTTFESSFTLAADRTISNPNNTVDAGAGSGPAVGPVDPALPWFIFPVPNEPVGQGATWQLTGALTLFGIVFDITVDVRVVELGPDDYRLRLDAELAGPEAGEGQTMLQGTGVVTGDPARIGPSTARVTAEGGTQRLHLAVTEE